MSKTLAWLWIMAFAVLTAASVRSEQKPPPPPQKKGWMDCRNSPEKHPGAWRPIQDTPEQAAFRKELAGKGRIVFASNRDGNWEIYVCDANGGNQTNLSKNPAWDFRPRWSPDGKRIIFHSDRDSKVRIADKTDTLMAQDFAWTPPADYGTLPGCGTYAGTDTGVYSMNPDGTDVKKLASPACNGSLSPDGRWLVYELNESIWLKDLQDGKVYPGTPPYWGGAWEPSFSPDGKLLLCMTGHWTGYSPTIFPLGADGLPTGKYTVLCNGGENCHPRWSPDGKRVIYCNDTRGMVMRWVGLEEKGAGVDNFRPGSDLDLGENAKTQLVSAYPAVSPDGQCVAFAQSPVYFDVKPKLEPLGYPSFALGRQIVFLELCVARADGKVVVQLTDGGFANRDPDWTAGR
jgi:Tol biopolymer transport system component